MTELVLSNNDGLYKEFGEGLPIGADHYRAWVGPPAYYDLIGATQFSMLTMFGMRETSTLLDVGCGSLRGGRFSIIYLRPGNYFGLEPNAWATQDGLQAHFGQQLASRKSPTFVHDDDFTLTKFSRKFDYLMAHSIFTHAAGRQIRRCMSEASKVMTPQSIFLATFLESENDHVGDEWVYPGVTCFRKSTITAFAEEAGLECQHINWPHPFKQKWFAVTLKGFKPDVAKLMSGYVFSDEAFQERKGLAMLAGGRGP